jgi:hypothetical protein
MLSNNKKLFEEYFGSNVPLRRFVNEKQRIKVANRHADKLLVSWVPGCYMYFDIPKTILV